MTGAFNQIQTIQQGKEIISLLKIITGGEKDHIYRLTIVM